MRNTTQRFFRKTFRFLKFRVLQVNDSAHKIALGIALGLLVACMPALGLHIFIVLALTFLLGANKLAGLVSVWACNPFTVIPILYQDYIIGKWLMGIFSNRPNLSSDEVKDLFARLSSVDNIFSMQIFRNLWDCLMKIGPQLWLGSIIAGLTIATISYFLTFRLICYHRKKSPHRRYKNL